MFPILLTAGMVLTLEDCFCWDLQAVSQVFFFTWAYTETLLVSLPPHIFIADFIQVVCSFCLPQIILYGAVTAIECTSRKTLL